MVDFLPIDCFLILSHSNITVKIFDIFFHYDLYCPLLILHILLQYSYYLLFALCQNTNFLLK